MWQRQWAAVVLVLVVVVVRCGQACYFSQVTHRQVCNSFAELDTEATDQWTNAIVQRGGMKPRTVLGENSFVRAPNLKVLSVHALVNHIEPGAFQGLANLDKLYIFDNDFSTIDPGIFRGLSTRHLQLVNNNMKVLPQSMFKELPSARIVTIDRNDFRVIPAGVLNGTSILKLYMQNNGIETIEEGAFFNMASLTVLNLGGNRLSSFESRLVLGDSSSLSSIWFSRNNFTKITSNMFTTVPYLEQIFMEINQITDIETDAFVHVPQLEFLDVSNNLLTELDPSIGTKDGLKRMGVLFVNNNRLSFINTLLFAKFPVLRYVTFGGNPFQCPCLTQLRNWLREKNITQLCDDSFYAGEKPSCVISPISGTSCIYDADLHQDLYELYVTALAEYGPIERLKCDTTEGFAKATLKKVT